MVHYYARLPVTTVLRPNAAAGVVLVGASLMVAGPMAPPQCDTVQRSVQLTSDGDIVIAPNGVPGIDLSLAPGGETIAYEMGGSTIPVLPPSWFTNANDVFVQPNYPGAIPNYLGYPAQFYPFSATLGGFHYASESAGQEIMNNALMTQLADGNNVVFYGTSQSATIQTMEMEYLMSLPADEQPSPDQLAFVDYGDPDLPNGGLFERFNYPELPGGLLPDGIVGNLNLPTIGIVFVGQTPADEPWTNVIYTGEYDGFADWPQYPLNVLADFNALLGTEFVHADGSDKPASLIATAMPWEPSPGYDGNTTYFIIPTQDLPLLDVIRGNPVSDAIADLLQPDLKVLINLGYGPDNVGWSDYPNVFTPATELFPDVNPVSVFNELIAGGKEGVQDFVTDLNGITPQSIMAPLTSELPTVTADHLDVSTLATELETLLTLNVNALSAVTSAVTNTAGRTADLLQGIFITLPQNDMNLILAGLGQLADGNLNGVATGFAEAANLTVGLGFSFGSFAELDILQGQLGQVESAFESASAADMDFLAGLPGLL